MRDYNGLYQAYVESTADPKNQRRITAKVPDVLGQTICNWARPASIIDYPMPKGAMVWIAFPNGDLRYPVYHVRNDPMHGRIVPGTGGLSVDGPGAAGVTLTGDVHAKKSAGGYVNMYAVDFIKTSSAAQKKNIGPLNFDPINAVQCAPAYVYDYKATGHSGVGPLLEDLPAVACVTDQHVSEGNLVGILWAAVSRLVDRVEYLETQVELLNEKP